jgi:hypothetical protein
MDNHSHESLVHATKAVRLMRYGAVCVTVLAVLGGCATAPAGTSKDIVARRAQERWDLLVKSDFAGAYRYISPTGRQLLTEQAYASGLRSGFWTGAKVGEVQCATEDSCEADVTIEYQHQGRKMSSPAREKWIRDKSNWWFVFER